VTLPDCEHERITGTRKTSKEAIVIKEHAPEATG
jgi:hypothetical protein